MELFIFVEAGGDDARTTTTIIYFCVKIEWEQNNCLFVLIAVPATKQKYENENNSSSALYSQRSLIFASDYVIVA